MSPGNIPTREKEQQGSRLCGAEMSSKGERMLWANPKFRNVLLNFLVLVLTDASPIASVLVWLCDSSGSFPVGQIGLSWENASVMETPFLQESLCCSLQCFLHCCWRCYGAVLRCLPCCCFIPHWCYLKVPDSTAGAVWESSAFYFCMKTYQVVYYP